MHLPSILLTLLPTLALALPVPDKENLFGYDLASTGGTIGSCSSLLGFCKREEAERLTPFIVNNPDDFNVQPKKPEDRIVSRRKRGVMEEEGKDEVEEMVGKEMIGLGFKA
ncbi:hypothetical protein Slin15195_G117000 [Septoria linicola]|uniref:Uncharacterized protein n=1 Tax=Septoria linicola TaxID=215465 RepID=A0A9Q9EP20_9PEZI|nr:hypothetical protein Slin14017_G094010 [Septoria linicola]USW58381.1 hypothetical protein Slin15195_G117000 [Septoria linicola]